jgi:hypothetical protein
VKNDTRTEVCSITNRKRVLVCGKCKVCVSCWIYMDNGKCMHGGPFSGYKVIEEEKK